MAEAIYKQIGLSRNESAEIVATILEEISQHLEAGENVKISSFGSFSVRSKNERIGRNPKTAVKFRLHRGVFSRSVLHISFVTA